MNFVRIFADRRECCRIVCIFYGLSVAITFAEKLLNARDYGAQGWFAWRVFRFDRVHLKVFRTLPRLMDAVFGRVGMSCALGGGLIGVVIMWLASVGSVMFALGSAATVVPCLLIHFRSTYGGDGSQQMNLLIGVAVLLGFNPWVEPATGSFSLLFIAAQSCLAYFTSGLSKLVSPIWTQGDPLVGILSTTAYGSDLGLHLVLKMHRLRPLFVVGMILLETLFPISVLGPRWLLLGFLLWGIAFHISNAVFMGLNTFLWSFLATYPTICYAWLLLH